MHSGDRLAKFVVLFLIIRKTEKIARKFTGENLFLAKSIFISLYNSKRNYRRNLKLLQNTYGSNLLDVVYFSKYFDFSELLMNI